ncbi:SAYSvFN domain-containing protein 1 [Elgaria multicarinata webbii]|uniref:SAYSvFN domain-containing protein 1 n=1 Tax=Elgaria multicarinata webbii TaxID=159646 RepID=UPI002FCD5C40
MEQRLAEFRAARRGPGDTVHSAKPSEKAKTAATVTTTTAATAQAPIQAQPPNEESIRRTERPKDKTVTSPLPWWTHCFLMNVTFLKFLLWLVLLGLFVELEFGLPYFVLSMFYWIYVGTRGPEERQTGEKSAYSVFNPGCEAIEGTLTAEQFERELQYRPLAER